MKRLLVCLALILPTIIWAQCLCPGGRPIQQLRTVQVFSGNLFNPSASANTFFWPYGVFTTSAAGGDGATVNAAGEANRTVISPGNIHIWSLTCNIPTAPGTSFGWYFALRAGGVDKVLCFVANSQKSCTSAVLTTGVAVTDAQTMSLGIYPSGTPATFLSFNCVWTYTDDMAF